MKKLTILGVLLLQILGVFAQTDIAVKGRILDETTKEPVMGASIVIKGTAIGAVSGADGTFELNSKHKVPFKLTITNLGYETREIQISGPVNLGDIFITEAASSLNEMVVSASKVSERILQSPVTIEKMDMNMIKQTPSHSFFDAIENMKGVTMTTLSLGFKVPNTRGFAGTTNSRFLQLVDGVDVTSPGIGAPIANTVGPTELDIQSVEMIPGASSSLYGMNAINGLSSLTTKSPFDYQGLSIYQKTGINHVNDNNIGIQPLTETAVRYAKAFNNKWAFKVNFSYFKAYDWIANNTRDLNPNANAKTGLTGSDNPAQDNINSYGNESQNRRDVKMGNGITYQVARTGYYEKELMDYNVENVKGDATVAYRLNKDNTLSYTYRLGKADNVYQRGNRIRIDDLVIQQHKLDWKGKYHNFRTYYVTENTGNSWNARPLAENLDRAFKSDNTWFADYKNRFDASVTEGLSVAESHTRARVYADSGRYRPGTAAFNNKVKELNQINNWDKGAALKLTSSFVHAEGDYNLTRFVKVADVLVGADARNFTIVPDGNSFINPAGLTDPSKVNENLYYYKLGGFVQVSKKLLAQRLKLIGSLRIDEQKYFTPKLNPRVAGVYSLTENNNFRVSYQSGYRFPTLFEGFSYVDNGGVKRLGGLKFLSEGLNIVDNSFVRTSQQNFNNAVRNDINAGLTEEAAIEKNKGLLQKSNYGYIKPEHINSFEIGYKGLVLNKRLYIDVDYYFNVYQDFIGQVEVSRINKGSISSDSAAYFARTSSKYAANTVFRLWTNSSSQVSIQGISVALNYTIGGGYTLYGNFTWSELKGIEQGDALIPAFNTPTYITNISFGNKEVFKNVGFNVTWRWQDAFYWDSPLATGIIPAYQTLDAQVTYRIPKIYSQIKLGATNLLNNYYTQYEGGPSIGGLYYLSWTIDGLLK